MKLSPNRKSKTTKPHANNTHFEITEFQNNETVTPARHQGKRRIPKLRPSNLKTITHNPKPQKPKDPKTHIPKDPKTPQHNPIRKATKSQIHSIFKTQKCIPFSTLRARGSTPNIQFANVESSNRPWRGGGRQQMFTPFDLYVSSLRRGHANFLCIVPI